MNTNRLPSSAHIKQAVFGLFILIYPGIPIGSLQLDFRIYDAVFHMVSYLSPVENRMTDVEKYFSTKQIFYKTS